MTARRMGARTSREARFSDDLPLTVVVQSNAGRFEARRAGIAHSQSHSVLLLDGRVRLRPQSLAFAHHRVADGETVWNGHVHVEVAGNPYGAFSNVLVELAWREYFDDPRTTSYGVEEFDRYPKGTTCFLAPRSSSCGRWRSSRAATRTVAMRTTIRRCCAGSPNASASISPPRSRATTGRGAASARSSATRSIAGRSSSTVTGGPSRGSSQRSSRSTPRARGWRSWLHAGLRSCPRSDWASP